MKKLNVQTGHRDALASIVFLAIVPLLFGNPLPVSAGSATVSVNAGSTMATIPATAFGLHTSVYDNYFNNATTPGKVNAAGIQVLRYPGGGYADIYHWSTYKASQWKNLGTFGYLANGDDFGHFAKLVASVTNGQALITVDYGSNMQGNGPGQPKEAAAWVAYCNGSSSSTQSIGVDASGNDWKTVGYWASLRAASPLGTDDGKNFLRIAHSASLNVKYWEIGNEVYSNGYYGDPGGETDWHAPYNGSRTNASALSPSSYGTNVKAFLTAMKAVDSSIKIGAVVSTQPYDTWDTNWNAGVLGACGSVIDFVSIHTYVGKYLPPNYNTKNPADLLSTSGQLNKITSATQSDINAYCGSNAPNVKIWMTETNGNPLDNAFVNAMYAADVFTGYLENGVQDVVWLEMHNTFLDGGDTPQGPYYAIQMAHTLEAPGDAAVSATSDNTLLGVHASKQANGNVGILLINKDPSNSTTVSVVVNGATLSPAGTQTSFAQGSASPTTSNAYGLGNSFVVTVPAYSLTEYSIPQVLIPDGTYTIANRNSGQVIDIPSYSTTLGKQLEQYTITGGTNQKWQLTNLGYNNIKLLSVSDGLSIDVSGSAIVQQTYTGASSQIWHLTATSGGYYKITGTTSGLAIEVPGSSTTTKTLLDELTYSGSTNQQWKFQ